MTASTARPRWITPTLNIEEGQDPLGLQSMTQDRLMPWLVPGILELSQVARYFSVHAFLLDEYRRRRLPANLTGLARFIKMCEWDLGLAVLRCPHQCGISPIGMRKLRAVDLSVMTLPRGESVETSLGGYGQNYRSPMATLGLVARAGALLGEDPTPVDVLHPDSSRAARLVAEFRAAVEETEYVRRYLATDDPIPVEVIEEYAAQACLCGLADRPDERAAVHAALFGADSTENAGPDPDLVQRRRTVAHFLTLVDAEPDVAVDETAYRRAAGNATGDLGPAHTLVAGQWAGVMAKDVWQDAVCSLWSSFCRAGLSAGRQVWGGLAQAQLDRLVADLLDGSPQLDGNRPVHELVADIEAGTATLPVPDGEPLVLADANLEDLRAATAQLDTATSGLLVILELARRVPARIDEGWRTVLNANATWQPSVREALARLDRRVQGDETVHTTLRWLLDRFVLSPHERIAYSKMAESRFTFRFRWDDGRLRFIDNGVGRFRRAGIRHDSLRRLTYDLGLWTDRDSPQLTGAGRTFVHEVLA